jgi:hypothetical protein
MPVSHLGAAGPSFGSELVQMLSEEETHSQRSGYVEEAVSDSATGFVRDARRTGRPAAHTYTPAATITPPPSTAHQGKLGISGR